MINKTVSYDVEKDLAPIALLSSDGLLLLSSPSVPAQNLKVMFDAMSTGNEQIRANRLRAYGVSSPIPEAVAPQYQPPCNQGIPELKGFDVVGWSGLLAPKAVPPSVATVLASTLRELLADPAFRADMLRRNTSLATADGAKQMASQIRRDTAQWASLVKTATIRLDP
ncbi:MULTISPECIES: tripartite tricarboxylate transporter substrate-binding protein [unclassified Variovorax]|uniref:tripartite tricarboxylate transporter substrate-binding protein n=1 Tax=unclassified Variovorax TaxID=663243 RepID=UPI003F486725